MRIDKKASRRMPARRRVMAETEVAPEATELLFEATDVAELVAEVTGEDVVVETSEDAVEFTVGEDVYTVEPEGDEEMLEASTRVMKRKVQATTDRPRPARKMRRRR